MKKYFFIFYILIFDSSLAQVELVNVSNPVYDFLKRMNIREVISGYNSSDIPLSRNEISDNLIIIKNNYSKLNSTDKKIFKDLETEFEFEMYGTLKKQFTLLKDNKTENIFSRDKSKYLFSYSDSDKTFFADIQGGLSQRGSSGDSIKDNSFLLGDYGIKIRGSMYGKVGYLLNLKEERILSGNDKYVSISGYKDPLYRGYREFIFDNDNHGSFEGYLRYQTSENIIALTFGRTQLNNGKGFIDNLFLSGNTLPFDFGKLSVKYKSVNYSFTYGSINGDSAEIYPDVNFVPLNSKNIATHYLNINLPGNLNLGFWESVVISNQPFSFTYLNPVSFLTSADLSSGKDNTTENNSLIGIDFEITPVRNLSFQSTLLIDDLTFGTLFKKDSLNENKFGWQLGMMWANSLNMNLAFEYTHLDPFVYSHRSNKSTYTNYLMPLGHARPPNSDELAFKLNYNITNRLTLNLLYRHQRSGEGIDLDSSGNITANYGGNINFGQGDAYLRTNSFLDGIRINRDLISGEIIWEPIKQYFVEGKFHYGIINNISEGKKFTDRYYIVNLRIEI